jgi:hypothetical protein
MGITVVELLIIACIIAVVVMLALSNDTGSHLILMHW